MKNIFLLLAFNLLLLTANAQLISGGGIGLSGYSLTKFKSFNSKLSDTLNYSPGAGFGLHISTGNYVELGFNYFNMASTPPLVLNGSDNFSSFNFFGIYVGRSIQFGGDKSGMYLNPNIGISLYNFSILSSPFSERIGKHNSINLYTPIEVGYKFNFDKHVLRFGLSINSCIGNLGLLAYYGANCRYTYFLKG